MRHLHRRMRSRCNLWRRKVFNRPRSLRGMRHLCRCVPLRRHFFGIKNSRCNSQRPTNSRNEAVSDNKTSEHSLFFVTSKKISTIKPRNARSFQRVITLQKCNCRRNDSRKKQATSAAKSPRPAEFTNISFSHEKTSFHSSADLSRLDSHESRPAALCPEPTSDSPSACSENGNSRITGTPTHPFPLLWLKAHWTPRNRQWRNEKCGSESCYLAVPTHFKFFMHQTWVKAAMM